SRIERALWRAPRRTRKVVVENDGSTTGNGRSRGYHLPRYGCFGRLVNLGGASSSLRLYDVAAFAVCSDQDEVVHPFVVEGMIVAHSHDPWLFQQVKERLLVKESGLVRRRNCFPVIACPFRCLLERDSMVR